MSNIDSLGKVCWSASGGWTMLIWWVSSVTSLESNREAGLILWGLSRAYGIYPWCGLAQVPVLFQVCDLNESLMIPVSCSRGSP